MNGKKVILALLVTHEHLTKSITPEFPFKNKNLPSLIVWNSSFFQFWWYGSKDFAGVICKV